MTEIVTERLVLRPFRMGDLEGFVAYRSDPDVARYQGWDSSFSMAEAESFLDSQRGITFGQPGEWLQLAIVDRENDTLYGDCAVRVLADQPTAELGVTLAPASQGKGIAAEALTAVITELFDRLGLHRVFAETDDRNKAVHRLFERLGFRCEARLVESDWFKGEWTTVRIYACLDREWGRPARSVVTRRAAHGSSSGGIPTPAKTG